jgi:hypothetical protein
MLQYPRKRDPAGRRGTWSETRGAKTGESEAGEDPLGLATRVFKQPSRQAIL